VEAARKVDNASRLESLDDLLRTKREAGRLTPNERMKDRSTKK